MNGNASHYIYRVEWSPEDQEYVGLCSEFPSLSWLAKSDDEAFSGIRALVADVVADMERNGETIPEPLVDRAYSGKILFRTTAEMHRRLAIRAAESKVSLNRYLNGKLTSILG